MFTSPVAARPARINQIPNGTIQRCANCHVNPAGGGPRNAFGTVIENSYLSVPGASGVVQWQPSLAALDSDGDGTSNGRELQDPDGLWVMGQAAPGNPNLVTLPGTPNPPIGVPALSTLGSLLLGLLLLLGGWLAARPRHAQTKLVSER
jgi:hypothetical protein